MHYKLKGILIGLLLLPLYAKADISVHKSHGFSLVGPLKYPKDFRHFNYVNLKAPKKGTIINMALGGFNSLNPYNNKGVSAQGIALVYDSLMTTSMDEPQSEYGLIAQSIEYPEDKSWVVFNLRKQARFSDGVPLTAYDVVFTHNLLEKQGNLNYKRYFDKVKSVKAESPYRVRFNFKGTNNAEMIYNLGLIDILPKHYWKSKLKEFSQYSLTPPLGSGPYTVEKVKPNHSITYKKNKNYWGNKLAVNLGSYNFNRVKFDYYRDDDVAFEAFKARKYDIRLEFSSKIWATQYPRPTKKKLNIIKISIHDNDIAPMVGFIFNTRNNLFSKRNVRRALSLLFDFEWTNKHLFYSSYKRCKSYYTNSEFASRGLPSKKELVILTPLKDQIPQEVFTKIYQAPKTKGDGNITTELKKAYTLLQSAGWHIEGGKLIDNSGNLFKFNLLLWNNNNQGLYLAFKKNLARVGIEMNLQIVDIPQYTARVRKFEYDMLDQYFPRYYHPGNLERLSWSSQTADLNDSPNLVGAKNPAIDKIIEHIINAKTHDELVSSTRALDRVLLWNYYTIPIASPQSSNIAYWSNLDHPKLNDLYIYDTTTWWEK